jgi:hypothetical protein
MSVNGLYHGDWPHPTSEAERVTELEGLLNADADFDTFREVGIKHQWGGGRIDLLAVPKILDFGLFAFEVKGDRFDPERALKQSADYVGGKVLNGPYKDERITACFLYPDIEHPSAFLMGMYNLIAQWRVGRAFMKPYKDYSEARIRHGHELTLAIGYEVIWRSRRGWVPTKVKNMLLGKRTVGGSRREIIDDEEHEARPDLASLLGLNQTLTRGRIL